MSGCLTFLRAYKSFNTHFWQNTFDSFNPPPRDEDDIKKASLDLAANMGTCNGIARKKLLEHTKIFRGFARQPPKVESLDMVIPPCANQRPENSSVAEILSLQRDRTV